MFIKCFSFERFFTHDSRMPHTVARLSHRLGVRLSVRPSVRLSVTLVICIKTVLARITKSLRWAAARTLVFSDKISCKWVGGSRRTIASKRGTPFKRRYFATIGSSRVKTVADRYRHAAHHNKHW